MTSSQAASRNRTLLASLLLILGLFALILGINLGPSFLIRIVEENFSADGILSERTKSSLRGLPSKSVIIGLSMVFLSIVTFYFNRILDFVKKLSSGISPSSRWETMKGRNDRNLKLILVSLFTALSLLSLFSFPATFDEAAFLQVPKNLIRYNQYATATLEGFDTFNPAVSTGPAVLLPIALVFKLFGIGLLQARFVMLAFFIGTIAALYSLAKYLFDGKVALLCLFLLICNTNNDFVYTLGTTVHGEVPAIFFFTVGCLYWFRSFHTQEGSKRYLLLSGLFWAMAILSKHLFLFLIIALVLIYCLSILFEGKMRFRQIAFPLVVIGCFLFLWILWQISVLGFRETIIKIGGLSRFQAKITGSSLEVPFRNLTNIEQWIGWGLIIPSILYAVYLMVRQGAQSVAIGFILLFMHLWILWWLLGNTTGWFRHVFPGMVFMNIFISKFLIDIYRMVRTEKKIKTDAEVAAAPSAPLLYSMISVMIVTLVLGRTLIPTGLYSFKLGDYAGKRQRQEEFARYIREEIEQEAIVSGYGWYMEWPISFLADRMFRNRKSLPPEHRDSVPEYLIITPNMKSKGLAKDLKEFVNEHTTPYHRIDGYEIYKVREKVESGE